MRQPPEKRPVPAGLYAIVDPDQCGGRDPLAYADALLAAGVPILQLRDKAYRAGRTLPLARELARRCETAGALFIVNDRLDVAILSDAPALHLGPDDLPLEAARRALGPEVVIGRSTNQVDEALAAVQAGADYLAFGPLFETSSKTGSRMREQRGLDDLKALCARVSVPVFAVGGIDPQAVAGIAAAGAAGVAVIGALARAVDLPGAVAALSGPWAPALKNPVKS